MDPLHPLVIIIGKLWALEIAFVVTFLCTEAVHRCLRVDTRPRPAARLVSRLGWRRASPRRLVLRRGLPDRIG